MNSDNNVGNRPGNFLTRFVNTQIKKTQGIEPFQDAAGPSTAPHSVDRTEAARVQPFDGVETAPQPTPQQPEAQPQSKATAKGWSNWQRAGIVLGAVGIATLLGASLWAGLTSHHGSSPVGTNPHGLSGHDALKGTHKNLGRKAAPAARAPAHAPFHAPFHARAPSPSLAAIVKHVESFEDLAPTQKEARSAVQEARKDHANASSEAGAHPSKVTATIKDVTAARLKEAEALKMQADAARVVAKVDSTPDSPEKEKLENQAVANADKTTHAAAVAAGTVADKVKTLLRAAAQAPVVGGQIEAATAAAAAEAKAADTAAKADMYAQAENPVSRAEVDVKSAEAARSQAQADLAAAANELARTEKTANQAPSHAEGQALVDQASAKVEAAGERLKNAEVGLAIAISQLNHVAVLVAPAPQQNPFAKAIDSSGAAQQSVEALTTADKDLRAKADAPAGAIAAAAEKEAMQAYKVVADTVAENRDRLVTEHQVAQESVNNGKFLVEDLLAESKRLSTLAQQEREQLAAAPGPVDAALQAKTRKDMAEANLLDKRAAFVMESIAQKAEKLKASAPGAASSIELANEGVVTTAENVLSAAQAVGEETVKATRAAAVAAAPAPQGARAPAPAPASGRSSSSHRFGHHRG